MPKPARTYERLRYRRHDMPTFSAHILLASLIEVAFLVARSPDLAAAAKTGRSAMKELLERLLVKR